jgi:hypothetical protein
VTSAGRAREGAIDGRAVALRDVPSVDRVAGRPAHRRAVDRIRGDPTASDPAPGPLIGTQDRPAPAGAAPEEDRMRNRAW